MVHLDELDAIAIQALSELGVTLDSPLPLVTPTIPVASQNRPLRRRKIQTIYLLRLEYPLPTARAVANALTLPCVPQTSIASAEVDTAHFIHLTQSDVTALESWTAIHHLRKRWTKLRLNKAHKDPVPPAPRPRSHAPASPALACPARLSGLFEVPVSSLSLLELATLVDGRIRIWAGKYNALADCPGERIEGCAYVVTSHEEEEALILYEGDGYEVVAARFVAGGTEVLGRTFRFAGCEGELGG
ncbi:hypothetical protein C7974DRAFT_415072 [Boeremia exigua]|uniref:uncharacterized protein n=1 Tax=Boeremia exigua TaxID=749465 RepID=UPI001E8CA432|nr:uncharacterized protein C7974DRAFT_415072 [Boeremia exigua]KAH6622424.1 hypothetical protein C7974DRAFT_415072 [Boeremia exigua]